MKKLLTVAAVLCFAASAQMAGADAGGTLVNCRDSRMPNIFIATFETNRFTRKMTVSLTVPAKSPEGKSEAYTGECAQDKGAIEAAYTCNAMTSTDSGYEVRLFSIGGSSLHASIQAWNMMGPVGEPVSISHCSQSR